MIRLERVFSELNSKLTSKELGDQDVSISWEMNCEYLVSAHARTTDAAKSKLLMSNFRNSCN